MLDDLKIALRRLGKQRTFTATAVATLALGIGATTAIFSTVNATLLRPLPFPDSDDLYTLATTLVDGRWTSGRVTAAYFEGIRQGAPSVTHAVHLFDREDVLLTDEGESREVLVQGVSQGFFDLFGAPMAVGRGFEPGDFPSSSVVISYRLWQEVFGGDLAVEGRSLRLATGDFTILGVAAPEVEYPEGTDAWYAMTVAPTGVAHNYEGLLRVEPGTDIQQLRSELASVMAGLAEQYPQAASGRQFVVTPLVEALVGDLGPILLVVLAGAVLLLLLGSVNVATLLLGRGTSQTREVAVRAALGADRWSVIKRFLIEALVLAVAGTVAGLALAWLGVRALLAFGASGLPRLDQVPFDGTVLLFGAGVLTITTILVGLLPAVRLSTPDIRGLLDESGRSNSGTRATRRLLSGLVVVEVALAVTLSAGAGWLVRSYTNLAETDPGFDTDGRLYFRSFLGGSYWAPMPVIIEGPDGQPMLDPNQPPSGNPRQWMIQVTERLQASPQIGAVGGGFSLPLDTDWGAAYYVAIPGQPYDAEHQNTARLRQVTPGFFEAMGTRLLAGEGFTDAASPTDAQLGAVVNETFVRTYLPDRDPVGALFAWGFPLVNFDSEWIILGVVEDVKYSSLAEPADPIFYLPAFLPRQTVVVETTLDDPTPLIPMIEAEVAAVDPDIPVTVAALEDRVDGELVRQRLGLALMMFFAAISLALATVGIYGVIAHLTDQRTTELATRVAFGATPSGVRGLVMRDATKLAGLGVLLGLALAYGAGRFAESLLYEIRASDPAILATAAVVVLVVSLLAFTVPAARAAKRSPIDGLAME